MSSAEQATSFPSNFRLIVDALADYAKLTGIDLSKSPFAERLELSNSPQAILELLEEREKYFKEYRNRNRRLITFISPAVEVLNAFSGTLGEAVSLVSNTRYHVTVIFHHDPLQVPFPPAKAIFVGIDALLAVCSSNTFVDRFSCDTWIFQAASGITSSYDALLDLFECLGNFLKRLEIYTTIPPAPTMTNIIVKIMVELLSVLALATTQIKQGRFSKCTFMYFVYYPRLSVL